MAFRPLLRQRAIAPAAATAIAATTVLYPRRELFAESPETLPVPALKKPIYDDLPPSDPAPESTPPGNPLHSSPSPTSPLPTDRLAAQIRRTRLFFYRRALSAENRLNSLLTSFLHLESSFTHTLRSLAPPPTSNEKLLPGAIYVLVAAMAGSIVSRNRNVLVRTAVPLAVGIGAGYVVLPITMQNVGNLMWSYEERYPFVRENHLRIREGAERLWYTGKAHSQMAVARLDERVARVRESLEEWVKQGK